MRNYDFAMLHIFFFCGKIRGCNVKIYTIILEKCPHLEDKEDTCQSLSFAYTSDVKRMVVREGKSHPRFVHPTAEWHILVEDES